ncbi:MAG: 4Fe-4S binding protein [Candidatus Bathyarchaeota archaeon]|nr:4Fe-4S binding protein [Candidatus Bathyarchaeum tardum]WGM89516.1 MAG: 4Fe-4S binding protein [Candidatus Bathyarchaeum tardum]WNZ28213.1 MAG: 4Fe-4S binding protein [Candidatus Bathyarchaeota archaeon]
MPGKYEEKKSSFFDLLEDVPDSEEEQKPASERSELLKSMGVEDRFEEGTINIDMRTCRGIECNLCVKACPTNALYWKGGDIGIINDLCIHCTACVANCMVDDCICVTRKRPDGKNEKFSNPKDVCMLLKKINSKKGVNRVTALYPTVEEYLDRHGE